MNRLGIVVAKTVMGYVFWHQGMLPGLSFISTAS